VAAVQSQSLFSGEQWRVRLSSGAKFAESGSTVAAVQSQTLYYGQDVRILHFK
jgi:hypothetical protein